jgi:serine/threonine protein phosphatase PrpC
MYAFGANTCAGISKPDNEDKIWINAKVSPPPKFTGKWPEIHFFGIYDGHGGDECSEFLKNNLQNYILHDKNFPQEPRTAIANGFGKAEKEFLNRFSN